jgi:uncharacterized protein involved in response to NO
MALSLRAQRIGEGLTLEALRLFFPLAALHAALWPLLWVLVHGYTLPGAPVVPAPLWHGKEMIYGAFGAALIGFVLSAMPEWTNTARLSGRTLWALAGAWLLARAVGLWGAEPLMALAATLDALLYGGLAAYASWLAWRRPVARLWAFAGWLWAFAAVAVALRIAFFAGDVALASAALHAAVLVFLALLALSLARIVPAVLNLVLDPSQTSTPFRPHPGRRNLATGMVAAALAAQLLGLSPAVQAFLLIGAGAAFLDRVGDAFIGRRFFRPEVLVLAGAAALAGVGLILMGLGRLGSGAAALAGLHVTVMGGLGLAVIGVLAVAGRLHTGQSVQLSPSAVAAALLLVAATALRAAPALGLDAALAHAASALLWAASFLVWLGGYLPHLADPARRAHDKCG